MYDRADLCIEQPYTFSHLGTAAEYSYNYVTVFCEKKPKKRSRTFNIVHIFDQVSWLMLVGSTVLISLTMYIVSLSINGRKVCIKIRNNTAITYLTEYIKL